MKKLIPLTLISVFALSLVLTGCGAAQESHAKLSSSEVVGIDHAYDGIINVSDVVESAISAGVAVISEYSGLNDYPAKAVDMYLEITDADDSDINDGNIDNRVEAGNPEDNATEPTPGADINGNPPASASDMHLVIEDDSEDDDNPFADLPPVVDNNSKYTDNRVEAGKLEDNSTDPTPSVTDNPPAKAADMELVIEDNSNDDDNPFADLPPVVNDNLNYTDNRAEADKPEDKSTDTAPPATAPSEDPPTHSSSIVVIIPDDDDEENQTDPPSEGAGRDENSSEVPSDDTQSGTFDGNMDRFGAEHEYGGGEYVQNPGDDNSGNGIGEYPTYQESMPNFEPSDENTDRFSADHVYDNNDYVVSPEKP